MQIIETTAILFLLHVLFTLAAAWTREKSPQCSGIPVGYTSSADDSAVKAIRFNACIHAAAKSFAYFAFRLFFFHLSFFPFFDVCARGTFHAMNLYTTYVDALRDHQRYYAWESFPTVRRIVVFRRDTL